MNLPYSVSRIANLLTLHGIPVEEVTDWDETQDGGIVITDKLGVQVGEYYIHVYHIHDTGMRLDPQDLRPGQLVNRLKELLR